MNCFSKYMINKPTMIFVSSFISVLVISQTALGISRIRKQALKDYFVEVENSFCSVKDNICWSNSNNDKPPIPPIPPVPQTDKMCCGQCSCDENTCDVIDSCCVETIGLLTLGTNTKTRMTCQYPQLKPFVENGIYPNAQFHYKMFTKCPDLKDGNGDLISKCDQSDSFNDITTKIPVTDAKTMFIYKNQYCAYCHNVSKKNLHHWDANIQCLRSTIKPGSIGTAVKGILDSENCNLIYLRPKTLWYDGRYDCRMVISSCNVTGLWKSHDPDIEAGCAAYETIFNFRYRNVFCYLCNSNDTDGPIICKDTIRPTVFIDFTAILKGQEDTNTIAAINPAEKCSINQIYDPIKKICRMIECVFPKEVEHGACVNLIEEMGGVTYGIFIRFTPYERTTLNNTVDFSILALKLIDVLQYWLDDSTIEPLFRSLYIYLKYVPIKERMEKMLKYFVAYVEVDFDLLFTVKTDVIDHMLAFSEYFNSNDYPLQTVTDVSYKAELDLYHITYTKYSNGTVVSVIRDEENESLSMLTYMEGIQREFPKTILTLHNRCPLLRLNTKEYNITRNNHTVYIKELGESFKARDVLIMNDLEGGFSVLMCVDIFKKKSSKYIVNATYVETKATCKAVTDSISALLSIVCSTISISFSVVTVIVYFRFKELKTQPGINNIIICLSVIVAQTLFQFGSGQSCKVSKAVCQGIGVLVHFSWLFLIFWMNSCCIHMFRVFRISRMRVVVFNKLKTTFMYIQYSFSASLTVILITIIVSLTKSKGSEIGYGGTMCYIQNVQMIAFSFTLPVGIVISVNIILFLVVILQMQNARMNNKKDRNFLHIYVKLSTLTGFTWVFGFLSFFFNVNAFDYLFIILNASQGMFLFFAFVANGQTLHFLFKRNNSQTSTSAK